MINAEEVLKLYRLTELTGQEIAAYVGCHDSYLPYLVRKHAGMQPTEYRKQFGWVGGKKLAIPPSKVHQVLALYDSGMSPQEVARVLRMGTDTARMVIRSRDGELRDGYHYARISLPDAEIAERYLAGENTVQLGEAYGVSEKKIRRVLEDQGVPRRGRGKSRKTDERSGR